MGPETIMFLDTSTYRIQKLQSTYRLTYNTTHQHIIDFDLEDVIYQYIHVHVTNILKLLRTFDTDEDQLLTDDLGKRVLSNLPKTWDYVRPEVYHLTKEQLTEQHHQWLLLSYNQLHNTNFEYEMIRGLL